MNVNPQVKHTIVEFVKSYLKRDESASVKELLQKFDGPQGIMEWEIRLTINEMIREGDLQISKKGSVDDLTEVYMGASSNLNELDRTQVKIVMSRPRLRELGFFSIQQRNQYLETTECFRKIIESSSKTLRICSPFIQKDVLSPDAFPELEWLFLNALKRGVNIKILSRQLFTDRNSEVKWLFELEDKAVGRGSLNVADYHLLEGNFVFSSTHAKILAADYESAYLGSAELRRNSIVANFEIGCFIRGPQVVGICEAFDLMFEKGKLVENIDI